MPFINLPFLVQINWLDTETNPPWNDASVNAFATKVRHIQIERRSFRGSLRSNTCQLTFQDPTNSLLPSKPSSTQYPNVVLGRRVRVLQQTAPGSNLWKPKFFGYIRDFQPAPTDHPRPDNVLLCDGPLAALADMQVKLSPSLGAVVWNSDDPFHTGLWHLLNEAGLYDQPAMLQLDNVGAVTLPDDWAGTGSPDIANPDNWTVKSFIEWLGYLAGKAECFVSDEPALALFAGDPDFYLHWYQTSPTAATDFAWSAPAKQLEMTPQLSYNGEVSF